MAGPIEQFQRDENFRRMDGDLSNKNTVYYYPSDLEMAYDSGHIIEFTVLHKTSTGIKEKLADIKKQSTNMGRGKDLNELKTAALKEIEADTKDGQGLNSNDTTIKGAEADSRRQMVEEIFGTIQNDPNAYDENGKLTKNYATIVNAFNKNGVDHFTRGNNIRFWRGHARFAASESAAAAAQQNPPKKEKTSRLAAGGVETTGESVRLYLPGGLNFSDSVSYKGTNFGLIKGLLEMNVGLMASKALSAAAGAVDQGLSLTGMEVNSAEAIEAVTGAVQHNRNEQLFEGQSMRSFDFSFLFRPRNKIEAQMMRDIVKLFRFHMRPELGPGAGYLLTPSEFRIDFYSLSLSPGAVDNASGVIAAGKIRPDGKQSLVVPNTFLPKIKHCALQSVTMNVNPDEIMETFDDPNHVDTPISLQLDLSFLEKEDIVRQDIRGGY